MSAERLRQAAVKVRETAKDALWSYSDDHPLAGQRVPWAAEDWGCDPGDQAHISLWSPTVALALADWLEQTADVWVSYMTDESVTESDAATRLADLILGGAS